jgi:hypothetical protein
MATKPLTLAPKSDGSYTIKRGDETVAAIVYNGEGWRACKMPGLRAFSPVGMDDLNRVKAYALRELEKEAA